MSEEKGHLALRGSNVWTYLAVADFLYPPISPVMMAIRCCSSLLMCPRSAISWRLNSHNSGMISAISAPCWNTRTIELSDTTIAMAFVANKIEAAAI